MADLINKLRLLIALHLLGWAVDVVPDSVKEHFANGIKHILLNLTLQLSSQALYHPIRFYRICQELELDPRKVADQNQGEITAIVQQFETGQIDEVQVMTALRNLSILNGGKWKA